MDYTGQPKARTPRWLNTKPKIGEAWDLFFEPQIDGVSSRDYIFNFCQHRPRDVLTYCSMAVDSAQGVRRQKVAPEDLKNARHWFSQSRFKDLGDEYSENYPQIQVVLSKFHGLAKEVSTSALAVIHRKLLADDDVKPYCHEWVYEYGDVYQFIELLYGIGFWGVRSKGALYFRGVGTAGSSLPPIDLANSAQRHGVETAGADRTVRQIDVAVPGCDCPRPSGPRRRPTARVARAARAARG